MKIKYDLTQNRNDEILMNHFKNIDDEYIFYYDETNNIRKFWFKDENKLNIPLEHLNKNFVLGGVLQTNSSNNFDIANLKNKLKLNKTINEIKIKHLAKGSFLECLKSQKMGIFLDWLYESNLYVHSSSLNILHWALVDIIDSIITREFIPIHQELKTILYEICKIDLERLIKILYQYEYPSIKRASAKNFLFEVKGLIQDNRQQFIWKYPFIDKNLINIILYLLDDADTENLTFIMDEEKNILIDNFFHFYTRTFGIFNNSLHILDKEDSIERIFEGYDFYDGKKKWDKFEFRDSKYSDLIQVSDIITGLLGKSYEYVNTCTFQELDNDMGNLTAIQQKNLSTIAKLALKSDSHSLALFHSIQSLIDRDKYTRMLEKFL